MLNIDDRLIREVSPKIGPNALSVLLAISIHLGQKSNRCFPSHYTLMQLTGMGKNAVYDALKVLKDAKLIVVNQAVNSKKHQFGKRTFTVKTDYIGVFVAAKDINPLPENREPENREPENREPENRETYLINNGEQINQFEQINNVGEISPAPGVEPSNLNTNFQQFKDAPPPPDPRWQEIPNSNTPREFETYLTRFYDQYPDQLEAIRERTQFQNNPTGVPAAIADFCAWAVGEGWNRRTLQQINARLGRWLREQTRFEQKNQNKKNEFKFRSPDTITDALDFAARWQREQKLGIPH